MADWGVPLVEAEARIRAMDLELVGFDGDLPRMAAQLQPPTRAICLALGHRACLALAQARGTTALTADRAWSRLDPALGIPVECVRPEAAGL